MTRYTLRTGFSLDSTPEGATHLTEASTGDALFLNKESLPFFRAAAVAELESLNPETTATLEHYRPFFVEAQDLVVPIQAPFLLSQEDNLKQALAQQPAEPEAPPAPAPLLLEPPPEPLSVAVTATSVPPVTVARKPTKPEEPIAEVLELQKSARRPVALTVLGLSLLVLGIVANFVLRPEPVPTAPPPAPVATEPAPTAPSPAEPEPPTAAPTPAPQAEVAPPPAAAEPQEGPWVSAQYLGRGRVKMSQLVASKAGTVNWEVTDGQRVKAKQALGQLTSPSEPAQMLSAPSVGLAMLKQADGAAVKKGTVLADLIYFEAWGKALVTTPKVETNWRCRVEDKATQVRADCRVLLITPRPEGTQVTVAVEPLWFDAASEVIFQFAPP